MSKAEPSGPAFWRKGRYASMSTCGVSGCGRIVPDFHVIRLYTGRPLSSPDSEARTTPTGDVFRSRQKRACGGLALEPT
jgi:hypothetical protein